MTPRLLIAAAATLVASFVLASLAHADGLRANAGYTGLYDPFPEIQHPCINDCERHGRRHHRRHRPPPPDSGPPPDQGLLVDCSGHGQFATLQDAVKAAQPNDVIEILAPGEGMTCVGTVDIHIPLTIRSAGGGARAVLQAPDHQSCLTANIPLGDALTIENVTFIARGREKPCVHVTAGKVLVRNSKIDSRNTNWAFDVDSSGDLTVEDSTIETDGSGVHAERATVCLKNIHVAVEEGHYGIGVGLDRTDGTIEGGTFIGGAVGILASSGPRGLKITDSDIRKARTAMRFAPGQQGQVE
ncbi:MAG TPA: hypothetical protein VHL34_05415, partial [Rhizomicrobium sp.]|nr:hypothetical protein [Rhizomicrobium sp.]